MKNVDTNNLLAVRADLMSRLESLKKEQEVIARDIEAVDRMLQRYGEQTSLDISDAHSPRADSPFRTASLREAVEAVLRRHRGMALNVNTIRDEVMAGGYVTNSKNLRPPIFTAIGKLVKAGEVRKVRRGKFKIVDA